MPGSAALLAVDGTSFGVTYGDDRRSAFSMLKHDFSESRFSLTRTFGLEIWSLEHVL